jgi:ribosome-associated protein
MEKDPVFREFLGNFCDIMVNSAITMKIKCTQRDQEICREGLLTKKNLFPLLKELIGVKFKVRIYAGRGIKCQQVFEVSNMKEVEISEEPIELYKILKLENWVASGGEAKQVIAEGQVMVNGKIETRKRKKILSGDVIEFEKNKIRIRVK